jgi:hypothetical protein
MKFFCLLVDQIAEREAPEDMAPIHTTLVRLWTDAIIT